MGALLSGAGAPEERQVPLDVRVLAEPLEPRRDDLRLLLVAQRSRPCSRAPSKALSSAVSREATAATTGPDGRSNTFGRISPTFAAGGADDLGRGAELGDERLEDANVPPVSSTTIGCPPAVTGFAPGNCAARTSRRRAAASRGLRPVGGELAGAILRDEPRAIRGERRRADLLRRHDLLRLDEMVARRAVDRLDTWPCARAPR